MAGGADACLSLTHLLEMVEFVAAAHGDEVDDARREVEHDVLQAALLHADRVPVAVARPRHAPRKHHKRVAATGTGCPLQTLVLGTLVRYELCGELSEPV